ncbi:hypothetical protein G6F50_000632 [Rhizopus delemar]|uniref:Peptide hydrolase n=1 Tax=Rhizopus delemar TaxID=936053 RepID=A0A9P6ZE18_9FUNG|nr:hypothetical protein G6F50_000632 [Rhizopus delemar]
MKHLAKLTDAEKLSVNGELMKPLLVERISGTPENEQVQQHIISHFERLGWHIELDRFTDTTPFGTKNFTNIIVTHNPEKPTRLVLAAHFDSKYSADFEFIGATDSAIPCGLLMDLAETLNEVLSNTSKNYRQKEKTVQMIFFDGEEAFHQWGPTDSIYGARHLAESWETAYLAHGNKVYKNKLDQIEVLVLLDLLGVTNTRFPNYYRTTSWLFYKLMSLETRLRRQSLLKEVSEKTGERLGSLFHPDSMLTFRGESIADDHVPFLMRGVNVLHLIPYPFPYVWHTRADTADCIDPSMVENLSILFRTFTAEYLELDPLPHNEL